MRAMHADDISAWLKNMTPNAKKNCLKTLRHWLAFAVGERELREQCGAHVEGKPVPRIA